MKNLLFVSQYFPPEIGAGAVRAQAIVKHLSKQGWNIDVLTETANYPLGEPFEQTEDHELPENVTISRVWVWMNRRETTFKKLIFFFSFAISSFFHILQKPFKYDVILVSSPPIFYAFSSVIASKILRVPVIVEIRDLWPDAAFQNDQSHESVWYKVGKKLEKSLYRSADHVVAVTESSANLIRRTTTTPVTVIENGVDTDTFKPIPADQLQLDEPLTPGRFRVGFIGSLGIVHDFRTLVQAAKICEKDADIEFLIIGDGSKHHEFHEMLEQYTPENLKWFGLKQHEKVPHYISSFDVGINPIVDAPVFESIVTVKFFEFLACGTPVISAGRGAIEDISSRCEAAVIVPPGDPEALAEAIIRMKNHQNGLPELREVAQKFIGQNYDRNKLNGKYEGVLAKLI